MTEVGKSRKPMYEAFPYIDSLKYFNKICRLFLSKGSHTWDWIPLQLQCAVKTREIEYTQKEVTIAN